MWEIHSLFHLYRDVLLEVKRTFIRLRQIFLMPYLAIIFRLFELLALKNLMQNGDFVNDIKWQNAHKNDVRFVFTLSWQLFWTFYFWLHVPSVFSNVYIHNILNIAGYWIHGFNLHIIFVFNILFSIWEYREKSAEIESFQWYVEECVPSPDITR